MSLSPYSPPSLHPSLPSPPYLEGQGGPDGEAPKDKLGQLRGELGVDRPTQ